MCKWNNTFDTIGGIYDKQRVKWLSNQTASLNIYDVESYPLYFFSSIWHIKAKEYKKSIGFLLLTLIPFISSGVLFMIMSMDLSSSPSLFLLFRAITMTIPSILILEGSYFAVLLGLGFYLFGKSAKTTGIFYFIYSIAYFIISEVDISSMDALLASDKQWFMVLALPLLLLYNHEKGKSMKYFFYLYYPLHLYVLWILSYACLN